MDILQGYWIAAFISSILTLSGWMPEWDLTSENKRFILLPLIWTGDAMVNKWCWYSIPVKICMDQCEYPLRISVRNVHVSIRQLRAARA